MVETRAGHNDNMALQAVATQLCVALDSSGSISAADFTLIKNGLAAAVRDASILPQDGTVELSVVQFPGPSTDAQLELPPIVINSATVADTAATQIEAIPKGDGGTPTDAAIDLCTSTITSSAHFPTASRQVINIATDGEPSDQTATVAARNRAIAAGIDEIDAEAIGSGVSPGSSGFEFLLHQLSLPEPGVVAPPFKRGGFVVPVTDAAAFKAAIAQKIQAVIRRPSQYR